MQGEHGEEATCELLGDLTWARELAVSLVGEAFADDVLQETRVAVLRSGGAVAAAEQIPPRAWLRVVLQRFALQVLRSEGTRKRREKSVSREEALPSLLELSARLEQQQLLGREVSALGDPTARPCSCATPRVCSRRRSPDAWGSPPAQYVGGSRTRSISCACASTRTTTGIAAAGWPHWRRSCARLLHPPRFHRHHLRPRAISAWPLGVSC